MTTPYRKTLLALCLALSAAGATAQQSAKLDGTVIGSKYSVDYNTGNQSTTANPKSNVFDGDFDTFFASYDRSNTWVGLDLGTPHIITRVGWAPRKYDSGPKRTQLAVFEGANEPDFRDAVPLYINPEASELGRMHYADVDVSRGFRYVRYVGPHDSRCNLGELAFYGYAGAGDDSKFYQLTNLPTVSIHTFSGQDPEHKGQDFESNITVIYDGGTLIQEYPVLTRVRGNASAGFAKKPYRVKFNDGKSHRMMKDGRLESKAKAKKWTLLSNYGDKTLMRNLLGFEVCRRLEMPYSVWGHPVDVLMNGEYHGCYNLCDQITIDPNRIPITEMMPSDTEVPLVRGGYLVEIDAYAGNEPAGQWFSSNRGTPVTIKEPGEGDLQRAQYNYIKGFFNEMEARLYADNYRDSVEGYRSRLDLESFLRYFLMGEFSGNTDAFWSVYMYKDRFEDQFHVSPGWDFDLAFENDSRTYPICNRSNWLFASGGSLAGGMGSFVNRILGDADAMSDLKRIWKEKRDSGAFSEEALLGYVDSLAAEMDASADLNFKRWDILHTNTHLNPQFPGSFLGEVEIVKKYMADRIAWMDNKLNFTEGVTDDGQGRHFDIASAKELVDYVKKVNAGMVYASARLTADLNLLAYRSQLAPIGSVEYPYKGTFDGGGHVLKNVGCMLFGTTNGATIKGIGIENGSIVQNLTYAAYTGTLVGHCAGTDPTTIKNCYSRADLISATSDAGGLVGKMYGSMTNCFFSGTIRVSGTVGGLIGSSASDNQPANVEHCYVASPQIRTSGEGAYKGALAGYLHTGSQLFRCCSLEELEGVVGMKYGTTSLCFPRSRELFASGNICWFLNENSSVSPNWFQHLGEDDFPLLDDTRGVVIYKNGEYANLEGNSIDNTFAESNRLVDVYNVSGRLVRKAVPAHKALQGLPHGLYIVDGVKVVL